MRQRTKIVATVGPATRSPSMLRALLRAGVDVFRINFSHGDRASHAEALRRIRAAERDEHRFVAVLGDLQGPRIRVGVLPEGGLVLERGARVRLSGRPAVNLDRGPLEIPVSYASLARDVKPGDRIFIADGQIELRVHRCAKGFVAADVVRGGPLTSRKGINLPDSPVSLPTLTVKDRSDLAFAAENGLDFIGVSFAREASDIRNARKLLRQAGSSAEVIAKIERREALADLPALIDASDGVMVARGDLAVEIGYERVPELQKQVIREANLRAKPVITATQMLESMVHQSTPTRAEASDIANAILDGTDAVMLSAETSIGQYPLQAVRAMARIAEATERSLGSVKSIAPMDRRDDEEACALARAGTRAAVDLDAKCIVAFTLSGRMARLLSRERILTPVLACARDRGVLRRLSLAWGVLPVALERVRTVADLAALGEQIPLTQKLATRGDVVVILVGRHEVRGGAHALHLARIGARGSLSSRALARDP